MLRMIHMNNGVPGMIMGLAGIAGQKGYNGDNMVATSAWLYTPAGVFLDAYDNPYVAGKCVVSYARSFPSLTILFVIKHMSLCYCIDIFYVSHI